MSWAQGEAKMDGVKEEVVNVEADGARSSCFEEGHSCSGASTQRRRPATHNVGSVAWHGGHRAALQWRWIEARVAH